MSRIELADRPVGLVHRTSPGDSSSDQRLRGDCGGRGTAPTTSPSASATESDGQRRRIRDSRHASDFERIRDAPRGIVNHPGVQPFETTPSAWRELVLGSCLGEDLHGDAIIHPPTPPQGASRSVPGRSAQEPEEFRAIDLPTSANATWSRPCMVAWSRNRAKKDCT